jgi:geranylgeranyl pyrophosphate synthase
MPSKKMKLDWYYTRVIASLLIVIAVLLIVVVCIYTRALKANRMMEEVEERFGLKAAVRSSLPRSEPLRNLSVEELLRVRTFDEYRQEVDGLVERALTLGEFGRKNKLSDACAHALHGGKRLRPVIIMEISRALTVVHREMATGVPPQAVDTADAALFIEYLHTASIVVDDLPAFDDDDERRGELSVHRAVGPAVAHMAALSLISAAFQDICRQIDWIRDHCPEFKNVDRVGTRLCHDVSQAIGAHGAAKGQFMDSSLSRSEIFADYGDDAVLEIMQLKTATFFEICFSAGWLIAGGSTEGAEDLQRAGCHFGTAFQVSDDIGDMVQDNDRRESGKPGWNYANEYGISDATRTVAHHLNACRLILEEKNIFTPLWREIYTKVWGMASLQQGMPLEV